MSQYINIKNLLNFNMPGCASKKGMLQLVMIWYSKKSGELFATHSFTNQNIGGFVTVLTHIIVMEFAQKVLRIPHCLMFRIFNHRS